MSVLFLSGLSVGAIVGIGVGLLAAFWQSGAAHNATHLEPDRQKAVLALQRDLAKLFLAFSGAGLAAVGVMLQSSVIGKGMFGIVVGFLFLTAISSFGVLFSQYENRVFRVTRTSEFWLLAALVSLSFSVIVMLTALFANKIQCPPAGATHCPFVVEFFRR
ncbi:hypothetical protein [Achromobacter insuavis]|uniref:hypothetical protein n=1 Tax=Achromobacter insuavis TaxID=1287735 RepID=UPI001F130E3E|nr:hypothetical protein [Achromobacter insuavis]